MIKQISGGVCAAEGFQAAGIYCGIRKNKSKKDLALIASSVPAHAAAVYTTNLVKGAPLTVTKTHIADGTAQAVICNSGNANTCNADGIDIAEQMSSLTAEALGIRADDVVVASTGVIGQPLRITPIAKGIPNLAAALKRDGSGEACEAIMTTDTKKKEAAVAFTLGGKTCHLGGIAKGSGMIHPNMATMLCFITTDAAIAPQMLKKALSGDVTNTFNMVSIDGDTSTNDMVVVLANGMAGNTPVTGEGADFSAFMCALNTVTVQLCRLLADGLGLALVKRAALVGNLGHFRLLRAFGLGLLQRGDGKRAELVERLAALYVFVNNASLHVRSAGETIHFADVLGGENRLVLFGCVHYLELLGGSSAFVGCVLAPGDAHAGVCRNGNERCFIRRPRCRAVNGEAVADFARVLPAVDHVAHGHIAADSGYCVRLYLLRAVAASKLDFARDLAVADFGRAHDADLVAFVRVLNHKAVRHAGRVYLALGVAENLERANPAVFVLVEYVFFDRCF
jgi:glutamate N-acetyltransferase/amino-acid N-acetyltransferase